MNAKNEIIQTQVKKKKKKNSGIIKVIDKDQQLKINTENTEEMDSLFRSLKKSKRKGINDNDKDLDISDDDNDDNNNIKKNKTKEDEGDEAWLEWEEDGSTSSGQHGLIQAVGRQFIISPEAPLHRVDKATGLPVYKAAILKVGEGGGTDLCPFDCDCCF
jgi:hypothetical protein